MNSAIYSGRVTHTRHIPKVHSFSYPFFMWYLDIEEIERGISFGRWFSSERRALSRFCRSDYLGSESQSLTEAVKLKMHELTGRKVTGKVFGLMNLRTLGLYFSPVNFYYGFDASQTPSHFLAEVSNTPWNERHYYGHLFGSKTLRATDAKAFKVSPFNPENNQTYSWKIATPRENISINLGLSDERGHVFEAALRLRKSPLTRKTARKFLTQAPVMTASIVARIYWQALRIFFKGIPYIAYNEEKI